MAKFEEEKIITALHPEKAEVGKKYWYSDSVVWLKRKVENNEPCSVLKNFESPYFEVNSESLTNKYFLLYPYEEPPKQRWTHKMLAEWCIKRNGQFKYKGTENALIHYAHGYYEMDEEKEIEEDIVIRPFGQTEWVEPTVDIYERDCKKE